MCYQHKQSSKRRYLNTLTGYLGHLATSLERHLREAVTLLVAMLSISAFVLANDVAARGVGSQRAATSATCGQSRSVLVRFIDGQPALGVKVTLDADSAAMGGAALYVMGVGTNQAVINDGKDRGASPLSTPNPHCTPIITGTLTATTDQRGLVRFGGLGEGMWRLRFGGEVTHERQTASVVPAPVQGLFPQGRTRGGGGFVEQVTPLNEEGGPNGQPVQPGVGPTTSRYVLEFSVEQAGWLPGLDLAAADYAPPIPLASGTTVASVTPGIMSQESKGETSIDGDTQEFVFDASSAEVVPGSDQQSSQASVQTNQNNMQRFSAWWIVVLGLTVGGLVAIGWARRRTTAAGADEQELIGDQR